MGWVGFLPFLPFLPPPGVAHGSASAMAAHLHGTDAQSWERGNGKRVAARPSPEPNKLRTSLLSFFHEAEQQPLVVSPSWDFWLVTKRTLFGNTQPQT